MSLGYLCKNTTQIQMERGWPRRQDKGKWKTHYLKQKKQTCSPQKRQRNLKGVGTGTDGRKLTQNPFPSTTTTFRLQKYNVVD